MKPTLKPSDFNPSEDAEQEAVMEWAAWKHPRELKWLHHIPNETRIPRKLRMSSEAFAAIVRAKLTKMGLKPGVADLFLPLPRGGYHGLYIEMKRRHGGKISDAQKVFLQDMTEAGYAAVVVKGSAAAEKVIERYLQLDE